MIEVKKNTHIKPECNFCYDNKSAILQIRGKGFLVINICESCLKEINKQSKLILR